MAPKLHKTATTATAAENCGGSKDKHNELAWYRSSCCLAAVLRSHTDLQGSTVFPLERLKAHAEEGEAAGQVGICIFRVPASVRANEGFLGFGVFFFFFLVLKTAHSQPRAEHKLEPTWSTKFSGANSCLPGTAQRGRVQPGPTAAT